MNRYLSDMEIELGLHYENQELVSNSCLNELLMSTSLKRITLKSINKETKPILHGDADFRNEILGDSIHRVRVIWQATVRIFYNICLG